LVSKYEGMGPLRRSVIAWGDNSKINFTELWCEFVDWSYLAQDKDNRSVVANTVMILRVYKLSGVSWPAEELEASQEELCSLDLVKFVILEIWSVLFLFQLQG
jgi:hypothetical protein